MRFMHKNGRIVNYPAHFATSTIGKNLTPLPDEVEEEKVVLENSPNSATRVGKRVKSVEEPDVVADEDEE